MVLQNEGNIVQVTQFLPGKLHGNREKPSFSYAADALVKMTETDFGYYGELVPASEAG